MSLQPSLFDVPAIAAPAPAEKTGTLQAQFAAFHRTNPQVYNALHSLALELANRGRRKIGIKMLFELLRWDYYMRTSDPNSEFKINNNYAPFYARLLMERDSRLDGLFEIRRQRFEDTCHD